MLKPTPNRRDCSNSPISNMLSLSILFRVEFSAEVKDIFFSTLLQNTFLIGLDFFKKCQAQTGMTQIGISRGEGRKEKGERKGEKGPPPGHWSRVWTSLYRRKVSKAR